MTILESDASLHDFQPHPQRIPLLVTFTLVGADPEDIVYRDWVHHDMVSPSSTVVQLELVKDLALHAVGVRALTMYFGPEHGQCSRFHITCHSKEQS